MGEPVASCISELQKPKATRWIPPSAALLVDTQAYVVILSHVPVGIQRENDRASWTESQQSIALIQLCPTWVIFPPTARKGKWSALFIGTQNAKSESRSSA